LAFTGLYYICFFGIPAFASPLAYKSDGRTVMYFHVALGEISPGTLLLIAGGVFMMWAGYCACRIVSRRYRRFSFRGPSRRMP
jgi:hypothetical protein